MIVLDTNVVSEAAKPVPSSEVVRWLELQPEASLFTTAISQAELLFGVELMPKGRRRNDLHDAITRILAKAFADRILPFDSDAAEAYSKIAASRRSIGRPISDADAQIAAIARSRGAVLATRNVRDFAHCGIKVLNPWNE
jgi:predicted nucleic acid-binding protein